MGKQQNTKNAQGENILILIKMNSERKKKNKIAFFHCASMSLRESFPFCYFIFYLSRRIFLNQEVIIALKKIWPK